MQTVEVIAVMKEGNADPFRVRYVEVGTEEYRVIDKIKVLERNVEKPFSPKANDDKNKITYKCEAIQGNTKIPFRLQLDVKKCIWTMM